MESPWVQVSIDTQSDEAGREHVEHALAIDAEWIEVGTPLVTFAGVGSIADVVRMAPGNSLVVDFEAMDGVAQYFRPAASRGASVATVMVVATEASVRAGKSVDVATILCPEAYTAMKARDAETHDRIVLERADEAGGADVVVLAQASMAHLEAKVQKVLGVPVLSSPSRCVREVAEVVQRGSHDTTAATSPAARR